MALDILISTFPSTTETLPPPYTSLLTVLSLMFTVVSFDVAVIPKPPPYTEPFTVEASISTYELLIDPSSPPP